MRILVTGKNGQIGWEISRCLMPLGEVIALGKNECDLSRPDTLPAIIRHFEPDVIINAAAYTAVDKAEEEEELATIVNGTAVGVLAEEARRLNALLVHYSTDYVFDGTNSEPYTEKDTPAPINAYGRSKLAGEDAVRQIGCEHLILRTSWVYASRGGNFVEKILRLARNCGQLNIINDQHGTPTWARNIADATAFIVNKYLSEPFNGKFSTGLLHLTSGAGTTWYDFASVILEEAMSYGLLERTCRPKLNPVSSHEFQSVAIRPKNSCLSGEAIYQSFGLTMPDWRQSIKFCLSEYQQMSSH